MWQCRHAQGSNFARIFQSHLAIDLSAQLVLLTASSAQLYPYPCCIKHDGIWGRRRLWGGGGVCVNVHVCVLCVKVCVWACVRMDVCVCVLCYVQTSSLARHVAECVVNPSW